MLYRLSYACDTCRAGDGARTRDIKLGRLALYQLSYSRDLLTLPCPSPTALQTNGGGRIRTFEGGCRQIYSLLPLATWVPHPADPVSDSIPSEPTARIELATARLQIGCSTS